MEDIIQSPLAMAFLLAVVVGVLTKVWAEKVTHLWTAQTAVAIAILLAFAFDVQLLAALGFEARPGWEWVDQAVTGLVAAGGTSKVVDIYRAKTGRTPAAHDQSHLGKM